MRRITCILIMLINLCTTLASIEQATKESEFGTGREVGSGLEEFSDGSCIFFRLFFISGVFFPQLRRLESDATARFMKGGQVVEFFPDRTVLNVEANIYTCTKKSPVQRPSIAFKESFMKSLHFNVQWKRDVELRPAKICSLQFRAPVVHLFANRWDYYLEIDSKSVPLSDSLIITLVNAEDQTVRKFSARL